MLTIKARMEIYTKEVVWPCGPEHGSATKLTMVTVGKLFHFSKAELFLSQRYYHLML